MFYVSNDFNWAHGLVSWFTDEMLLGVVYRAHLASLPFFIKSKVKARLEKTILNAAESRVRQRRCFQKLLEFDSN